MRSEKEEVQKFEFKDRVKTDTKLRRLNEEDVKERNYYVTKHGNSR